MRKTALIAVLLLALSCREEPRDMSYRETIEQWQQTRAKRLKAEDGWLSLVGLYWLTEGTNELILPVKASPNPGTLTLQNGKVSITPNPSAGLTVDGKPLTAPLQLRHDGEDGGPTEVRSGTIRFYVIERAGRYGVRVKDPEAETRTHFRGLQYYPIDPQWRVAARFEPYNPPKRIPITDITGSTSDQPVPGALVFTVDGREHRLDPILEGESALFIIFKDETSKDTTYPAGRYLYSTMPGPDGRVIVDFNKAYSPPCAFTPYATCPLPPAQNRLPVRIEAGEKNYEAGHS